MRSLPARELLPGMVIERNGYPADIIAVSYHCDDNLIAIRWSVCPDDVMFISSATEIDVFDCRLDA